MAKIKAEKLKKTKFEDKADCFKTIASKYLRLERIESELQDEMEVLNEELMYGSKSGNGISYGQTQPKSLLEKSEIYASMLDEKEELKLKLDNISLILNRMNQIIMRLPAEYAYPCYMIFIKGQKKKFEGGSRYNTEVLCEVETVMNDMDVKFLERKVNDKSIAEEMSKAGLRKLKK